MDHDLTLLHVTDETFPSYKSDVKELFEREFTNRGHKIYHLFFSSDVNKIEEVQEGNNIYYLFPYDSRLPLSFFKKINLPQIKNFINNILKNKSIDIIQVRSCPYLGKTSSDLAKKHKIPFCYYLTSLFTDFKKKSFFYEKNFKNSYKLLEGHFEETLYRKVIKKSDLFQPISTEMDEYFKKMTDNKKTLPLPMCAPRKFLESKAKSNSNSSNKIVYIGQISLLRDPLFLLKVIKTIEDRIKDVELIFVGPPTNKKVVPKLRQTAKRYGISDNVKFLGKVDKEKIPQILRDCDIGVSPLPPILSYKMSSPTKVVEYLSIGLPVICNKEIVDQNQVVSKSGGGFSVRYDHEEFVDKL